jgi:hypothetical protein
MHTVHLCGFIDELNVLRVVLEHFLSRRITPSQPSVFQFIVISTFGQYILQVCQEQKPQIQRLEQEWMKEWMEAIRYNIGY